MQNKKEETNITPQWVTVKEELLDDFFNLSDFFSSYLSHPNDITYRKRWITKLRTLYLKCRLKISQRGDYQNFAQQMDRYIRNPQSVKINELIEHTLSLCQYIESTGITSVESESYEPIKEFENSAFPR